MRIAVIAALLAVCLEAATNHRLLSGWVSDAACGANHVKPGGEDCVRKCIRGGEHINPAWKSQKMVIVDDAGRQIWVVNNPDALAGLEGKHVRVNARIDRHAHSVEVTQAQPAEPSR